MDVLFRFVWIGVVTTSHTVELMEMIARMSMVDVNKCVIQLILHKMIYDHNSDFMLL